MVQKKSAQGLFSDVDGEEGLEEGGVGGEGAEGTGAESGVPVEKEQDAGHAPGQGEQGTVGGFVAVEGGALSAWARESARRRAWRKARARPSPVMASTEPEASPMRAMWPRATLERVTRGRRRVRVRQPRSVVRGSAPRRRPWREGRVSRMWVRRACGLRVMAEMQSSARPLWRPVGVM